MMSRRQRAIVSTQQMQDQLQARLSERLADMKRVAQEGPQTTDRELCRMMACYLSGAVLLADCEEAIDDPDL
jgi:hypothetical protein